MRNAGRQEEKKVEQWKTSGVRIDLLIFDYEEARKAGMGFTTETRKRWTREDGRDR
jgi:hypothetical protein